MCIMLRLSWLSVLFLTSPSLRAQNTITTQALSISSICPGSTIDVDFTRTGTYETSTVFIVQLSDGGDYKNITSGATHYNSSADTYTTSAVVPDGQAAGTTYSVRITANSPAIIGSPSPTRLIIKTKSVPPTVDSIQLDCQRRTSNDAYTYIYLKKSPGTIVRIYDRNLALIQNGGTLSFDPDRIKVYFQFSKPAAGPDKGFVYPVSETTYSLSQVNTDGCESDKVQTISRLLYRPSRAPIPVNQFANGFGKLSYCQGDTAYSLAVNGHSAPPENYRTVYTIGDFGSSTSINIDTPPIPDTRIPSKITYTLSLWTTDATKGCTMDFRPEVLSHLTVEVNAPPDKPTVPAKAVSLCQFGPTKPLSASTADASALWYATNATGGIGSTTVTQPSTLKAGIFTYYVAQRINNCESERVAITVDIKTAPAAPTVSPVSYCQGAKAQPLEATGTHLKWTDPNGVVSTTAPIPPTLNVTTKADGDLYYVTQTDANGCESPSSTVRIFIQTVPIMSILGTITTNLGLEVPLKLTFTGGGPYRYKLSDGLIGTALKDTTVLVLPNRTTTYQVVEVANMCGTGLPNSGVIAIITVRVPTIQTLALQATTVCAGTGFTTRFVTSGEFNSGSVFKLQVAKAEADTTKAVFMDIPGSQSANGQFIGALPANMPSGTYRLRIIATNPKIPIMGTISPTVLTVRALATATLTGNQSIYEGQLAKLSVAFMGDGPWSFSYRDSTASGPGAVQQVQASTSPYLIEVKPAKTTSYYLTSVSNNCGNGLKAGNIVTVSVSPLLGVDDQSLAAAIEVYPVPASTVLTVHIHDLSSTQPALLELTDIAGKTVLQCETHRETTTELKLDQQPAGIYLLRVRVGDRTASKRIVKL